MTQKELSDALRLDQTAISMLERDKVKNPRKITDIAMILAVPPAWLRFGVDNIESLTEDNVQALFALQNLAPEDQEAVRALISRLTSN